ncbi:MAG: hypothetical protein R3C13_11700 [Hyphomonas sp.]|uniref:hypothetical protein n=1 Tax=Hyphomonas sp. TaxID=87 RepID=UPI0035289825
MEFRIRHWTHLGLGAALAAGSLAACSKPAPAETAPAGEVSAPAETAPAAEVTDTTEVAAGLASSGGEGEGGVAIEVAATDPVIYNVALAVAEAHVRAARDAFAAGETDAAGEMFAHPVSEVLFDMGPVFEARGVADFTDLLTAASAAVYAGESTEQIDIRTDTILSALKDAATKAPDNGTDSAGIALGVISDMIDRASKMYRGAASTDLYEPYLDGYGFARTAEATFVRSEDLLGAEHASAAVAIREALRQLNVAYPTATRPDVLDADQARLTVAASNVMLALNE